MRPVRIRILPYGRAPRLARIEQEVEAILFATAARKEFASNGEREAFRHRWLDRYVTRCFEDCFVALDGEGHAAGYVVGSCEDVSGLPSFGEIAYFRAFAKECAAYPAHLHVNVRPGLERQGIGRQLVEAFCGHAQERRVPAAHVVTAAGAASIGFYQRIGFAPVKERSVEGKRLVMLGRRL
jgi:ribosomal protein S18 acetylase RimI-like enzyme